MAKYTLTHLTDDALLRGLRSLVARECANTAWLLAHLAEVDARRLYLPRGFASLHAYCVEALHLSEHAAYRRIQAARAARAFPALFEAVAEARVHLAAVCLLAPHLTEANASELIVMATHRPKNEIERWLAERFARPVQELMAPVSGGEAGRAAQETPPLALGQGDPAGNGGSAAPAAETPSAAGKPGVELAPGQVTRSGCARVTVRLELPLATQEKLRRAQALLCHAVPSGDVATVVDRALDALLAQLEKRRFAATRKPQAAHAARPARAPRTVPARVRRAVWQRDGERCAFVSADGRRCSARARLEFDHLDPVARGGRPYVERMRLLCRAHNQYEAERVFGRSFMGAKRRRNEQEEPTARPELVSALRGLGLGAHEARRRAELIVPGACIEDDLRAALRTLGQGRSRAVGAG